MKNHSLIEREVLVLDIKARHVFKSNLHGAGFLLPWAYMDPTVKKRYWEGPSWAYEKNGRKVTATIPLTVVLQTNEMQYWDVEDTRRGVPMRVGVKRAHAAAEGVVLRMFDQNFINENIVEYRNRRTGYFLLAQQVDRTLTPYENDVLAELGSKTRTLGQLCARLPHDEDLVRAAVMNLWREGRVLVPAQAELIGLSWAVRRSRDA
jgi:hypothetical protein